MAARDQHRGVTASAKDCGTPYRCNLDFVRIRLPESPCHSTSIKSLDQEATFAPPRFAGAPDALYERHLKFDTIVDPLPPTRANATTRPHAQSGTFSLTAG